MKNAKMLIAVIAGVTIIATVLAGLLLDSTWAIIVGTAGVLAEVLVTAYFIIKSVQLLLQRVSGLQRQQERIAATQNAINVAIAKGAGHTQEIKLPPQVSRALEDLTLASRSLTVPQAHFDQLLRTISANTQRTEAALADTVEELRDATTYAKNPQHSNHAERG